MPTFSRLRQLLISFFASLLALCSGCSVTVPSDVTPVKPFDANRYLGQWYEIARLDHSFERGLECVSA
ncbi:MAG: lipocalin family protein, partial [Saezia sp.]